MATTVIPAQPIAAGYAYGVRLNFSGGSPPFPGGCALRAEVRDYPGAPTLAGVLTSDSGLALIVDVDTVELFFAPALTGALGRTTCAVDLVRTDLIPAQWLGVQIVLPVVTTVTKSQADMLAPDRIVTTAVVAATATVSAPAGVSVVLSPAIGVGPWNQQQVIAPDILVSVTSEPSATVQKIGPATITTPLVATTVFAAASLTLFAGAPTIAPTSVLVTPSVQLAVPAIIEPPPAISLGAVAPPALFSPGSDLIALPVIDSTTAVRVPDVPIKVPGIRPATISTSVLPLPSVGLQQPQGLAPPPITSATIVPPPVSTPEAAKIIGGASVYPMTVIGNPFVGKQTDVVLSPTAIDVTSMVPKPSASPKDPQAVSLAGSVPSAFLPSPGLTQQSTNNYAADGYVADGYVGAS